MRIAELEAAGLISRQRVISIERYSVLKLTDLGRQIAAQQSPYNLSPAKLVDLATLEHDAIVTSVRLRLHELWDGHWVPERALKDKYPIIPDGLFQFRATGHLVAIEVENSIKGRSRFTDLLKEWRRTEGVMLVLYVATHSEIFRVVKEYLKAAPPQPAFALALWPELEAGKPVCQSPVNQLDLFSTRSL